ncbi:transporter substrate-binding domain-containing protein [Vibrio metschnikovii]|nr:transporter substrate-binding domain-containing protein [Vibrio metschnikovii]
MMKLILQSILASLVFWASVTLANTITLASGEWEPYQGQSLASGGPAAQVVSEAFALSGWQVNYQYLPWARGLNAAENAELDGTFLYSFNQDRAARFHYSEPVITLSTVVFYHPDKPLRWENEQDLLGKTLGGVVAYDYGFVREDAGYTIERISQPENNFRKLQAGRLDGVMEERLVGLGLAASVGFSQVAYFDKSIKFVPYHLIVSRKHPKAAEIIAAFNDGLKQLESNGRLAEILGQ